MERHFKQKSEDVSKYLSIWHCKEWFGTRRKHRKSQKSSTRIFYVFLSGKAWPSEEIGRFQNSVDNLVLGKLSYPIRKCINCWFLVYLVNRLIKRSIMRMALLRAKKKKSLDFSPGFFDVDFFSSLSSSRGNIKMKLSVGKVSDTQNGKPGPHNYRAENPRVYWPITSSFFLMQE